MEQKPKKKKKKPTSASNKKKVKQDTIEEEKYGAAGAEMEEDFQVLGDLENTSTTNSKKADSKALKKPKKATKKKKERLDGITRFFNDYGESPHLQAIEISYLKYLEAQHAKESHLKAVKKMQILRALKTIQRFWKRKYQIIRNQCASKI